MHKQVRKQERRRGHIPHPCLLDPTDRGGAPESINSTPRTACPDLFTPPVHTVFAPSPLHPSAAVAARRLPKCPARRTARSRTRARTADRV
eukprot:4833969-Prymnesium_polylepis.1